jgi:hypothetical protein
MRTVDQQNWIWHLSLQQLRRRSRSYWKWRRLLRVVVGWSRADMLLHPEELRACAYSTSIRWVGN